MTRSVTRCGTAVGGLAIAAMLVAGCSQTATKDGATATTSKAAATTTATASASSTPASPAAETTTLFYPDQQGAMFSIDAPSDWKVEKIDQVGDFGSLESENGSVLQFRAQNFGTEAETEQEIDSIVDSTFQFLKDNYQDIKLDDPKDVTVDGQPGSQLAGTGKDKDGNAVQFLSAMIMLSPTSLAEIWAAVFPEGNDDLAAATAVLDSFKPSKPQ